MQRNFLNLCIKGLVVDFCFKVNCKSVWKDGTNFDTFWSSIFFSLSKELQIWILLVQNSGLFSVVGNFEIKPVQNTTLVLREGFLLSNLYLDVLKNTILKRIFLNESSKCRKDRLIRSRIEGSNEACQTYFYYTSEQ